MFLFQPSTYFHHRWYCRHQSLYKQNKTPNSCKDAYTINGDDNNSLINTHQKWFSALLLMKRLLMFVY